MIRVVCLIGGLAGAAGLSQFPEFSQQYLQRLAGQVDELNRQVTAFDQTALADGMGREEMLQAMAATALVARQETLWRSTFARHARLSENLMVLRNAGPVERLMLPHRMADPATLQAAWGDFTPAMPLSGAGAASAATGFAAGWVLLAAIWGILTTPFRKPARKTAQKDKLLLKPSARTDPPIVRPATPDRTGPPPLPGSRR